MIHCVLEVLAESLGSGYADGVTANLAMPRGAFAPTLAHFVHEQPHTLQVAVTASGREAEELQAALRAYLPHSAVALFPSWETLPHERLSPRSDTVGTRMMTLRRLAHPEEFPPLHILIVPIRAFLQPIASGLGDIEPVRIRRGDELDLEDLIRRLTALAYTRVDMVESRGQFAIRGGIVDIFVPTASHPTRLELFGDEVDDIRMFSVSDQRSLETLTQVYASPCRELLLTDAVRSRASQIIPELPGAIDMLDKIANAVAVEGMESLQPILVDTMRLFLHELPQQARIALVEPERIRARAESLHETTEEFRQAAWNAAAAGGPIPVEAKTASFAQIDDARSQAQHRGLGWCAIGGFSGADSISLPLNEPDNYAGDMEAAIAQLAQWIKGEWRVVVAVEGAGLGRRLVENLADAEIPAVLVDDIDELKAGVVQVLVAPIKLGFIAPRERFALLGSADIIGRRRTRNVEQHAMPKRRKNAVDPLQLKPGDYVVHARHGVAQFVKLAKRQLGSNGTQREYVVLEYAASKRGQARDELWVPTDQLDQVSKYAGGESPTLNKMGGADWERTKAKARAAVKQIARELVRLYAQRRATKGHAFSPDTPWQRELEDAFEFVETPDQLATIDDVKRDMESPEPMDRLISGDVGYGKTEIAVRAAFKAVQDGMQVAILAPTTLLVQQHLETFEERYAGFPVRVAALSRFVTDAEAERIRQDLRRGTIDVVIGTHRLITGDVRFKNLGLVIVDEEQRFGVEHKETLKQLYPTVDVLSMSATPIPRTLEMAVTGIRQISTLATPPEERHPILTYVGVHENKQVAAAIKRELLRDGQVFYVHNRTQSIDRVAAEITDMIPEARVGVAHGKMSERQLEEVIAAFWNKDIDVLVCTTIVETGLDISNANTLIVENAHQLGLSQLHQLRGRVGRGRERAYAYFLYPPEHSMTQTAIERLRTIASHTELGAGFQVALKDLEIRGAGNLLGGEQSGHIAGVGFDLYIRMVSEAVAHITGQDKRSEAQKSADVRIELPVDAYVPESWVTSERLRLEIYTKIAASTSQVQRKDVSSELRDRYGEIPDEVRRLFRLAQLRNVCRDVGIEEITMQGRNLRFAPVELSDARQSRLRRLYPRATVKPAIRTMLVPAGSQPARSFNANHVLTNDELLDFVEQVISSVCVASLGS
ncbi:transcription-repair coupling factor [Trueperella sp. LYQ141]|uniref:transcription-repair coupling factor n=1 Tax=Trueperella sp. LYQ141 TaxID=3391058 RepID=UPI0039835F36